MRPLIVLAATSIVLAVVPVPSPCRAQSAPDAGVVSRSRAATEAIHLSGAVPRCWNAFLQVEPNAGSVRFRVRVAIAVTGAVEQVTVLDPTPTNLGECVRRQVRRVSLPAGEAVTVETTYAFSPGATAPVPSR